MKMVTKSILISVPLVLSALLVFSERAYASTYRCDLNNITASGNITLSGIWGHPGLDSLMNPNGLEVWVKPAGSSTWTKHGNVPQANIIVTVSSPTISGTFTYNGNFTTGTSIEVREYTVNTGPTSVVQSTIQIVP